MERTCAPSQLPTLPLHQNKPEQLVAERPGGCAMQRDQNNEECSEGQGNLEAAQGELEKTRQKDVPSACWARFAAARLVRRAAIVKAVGSPGVTATCFAVSRVLCELAQLGRSVLLPGRCGFGVATRLTDRGRFWRLAFGGWLLAGRRSGQSADTVDGAGDGYSHCACTSHFFIACCKGCCCLCGPHLMDWCRIQITRHISSTALRHGAM